MSKAAELAALIGSQTALSNRNLIINGEFQCWQRGVSQTSAGYGSVDRFQMSNSTSTFTTTQQAFTAGHTNVPNNPKYYLRCVVSSGGAAGNYVFMSQAIEGVQTGAGQTVTLSFYAKASSALKVGISYQQIFGTSGSSTVSVNGVAKTLSTSWARYTVTTTLPSISSKTIGTASDSLRLLLWFDSGSTYNTNSGSIGNQSGTFEFSNIQLEIGEQATPFEHRSFGDELAACQRYFETIRFVAGTVYPAVTNQFGSGGQIVQAYKVTKRTTPTVSIDDTSWYKYNVYNGSNGAVTISAYAANEDYGGVSHGDLGASSVHWFYGNSGTTTHSADAEL